MDISRLFKRLNLTQGLVFDAISFVLQYIRTNKLRTFLSLLGVTIGIFTIVAIFIVIDSMKNGVTTSLSKLGNNIVYVEKWPWSGGPDTPWWKYARRPQPKYDDYLALKTNGRCIASVGMRLATRTSVEYKKNRTEGTQIIGFTPEFAKVLDIDIEKGRFFSQQEYDQGTGSVVLGHTLAYQLFPDGNAVGKTIKVAGFPILVIGVTKEQGSSMFGMSVDENVLVTYNYIRRIVNTNRSYASIALTSLAEYSKDEFTDDVRRVLRAHRGLRPTQEDNFSLNTLDTMQEQLDSIFGALNMAGFLIGGLSILVGGFGIANIMFVSVKERTKIIGIQKSLGAKKWFILLQFLFESTLLSLLGGLFGLTLLRIIAVIVGQVSDFTLTFSIAHLFFGLLLAVIIGVISGYLPARNAAELDPVKAIDASI